MAVNYKLGRIPTKTSINPVDAQYAAQSFYNNRFDVLDNYINQLNTDKSLGAINDLNYIDNLTHLQNLYKQRGFNPNESAQNVGNLKLQAEEAVAKQAYQDFVQQQQNAQQSLYNNADYAFAQAQDQYAKGKLSEADYNLYRDLYFEVQRAKGTYQPPSYSFDQFRPGANLNVYKSGRMRDIAREQQVQQAYNAVYGGGNNQLIGTGLEEAAGSYLSPEALQKVFESQKKYGLNQGTGANFKLPSLYSYTSTGPGTSDYKFSGTGGVSGGNPYATPTSNPTSKQYGY